MASSSVWFITGCSTGFGHALALEVLERGCKVIASARNVDKLSGLRDRGADIVQLDVTDSLANLQDVADKATKIYGRIDYLINNAGFSLQGTIEELSPEETQTQFDSNVFGLLNVTRAFLPQLRTQRSGVIANVSSIGAWRGSPGMGMYCASKWTVSGLSESMTEELADFGIKVCCIEPGYFRSNFLNPGNRKVDEERIKDYDGTAARRTTDLMDQYNDHQPGDVRKGVKVIADVLSGAGRAEGREVPKRLALGRDAYEVIKAKCEETLQLLEEWKHITTTTDHDDVKGK